ncbi:hypothetical protein LCGC14_3035910, partial [marine sediment metagenome]
VMISLMCFMLLVVLGWLFVHAAPEAARGDVLVLVSVVVGLAALSRA